MTKLSLTVVAAVATLALTACDGALTSYDCSSQSATVQKNWSKEKRDYCAAKDLNSRMHSHSDGTRHLHQFEDANHTHSPVMNTERLTRDDGVFYESDNDYDRESTLDNLTEDDQEIIEWRKKQLEMKRQQPAQ